MREHAVGDQRNAEALCVGTKVYIILNAAEDGVNLRVVGAVIAVVRSRFDDGVQIDYPDAEGTQIRKLFADAVKGAAVEIVGRIVGFKAACLPAHGVCDALVQLRGLTEAAVVFDALSAVAKAEAVGEYLIHDPALCPVGGGKAFFVHGEACLIAFAAVGHEAVAPVTAQLKGKAEIEIAVLRLKLKMSFAAVKVQLWDLHTEGAGGKPYLASALDCAEGRAVVCIVRLVEDVLRKLVL